MSNHTPAQKMMHALMGNNRVIKRGRQVAIVNRNDKRTDDEIFGRYEAYKNRDPSVSGLPAVGRRVHPTQTIL